MEAQYSRPPPPAGPPPGYASAIKRVYPYSLRPILLFTCFISFIYLIVLGIASFKYIGQDGETSKLKTFDIVVGVLFIAGAVVEAFGFVAAISQRISFARIYSLLSSLALLAVIGAEIANLIAHYSQKSAIIAGCTQRNTGAHLSSGWGYDSSSDALTEADAAKYCSSQWSNGSTWDIVWLLVTLILGLLFVSFSFAYVRQLLDPSSVRERRRVAFWATNQGPGAPSAQYAQPGSVGYYAGPYDPQAIPLGAYPPYAPPPGAPPAPAYGASGPAPPGYEGRNSTELDDRKSPAGPAYGESGYGYDHSRPGSSRAARLDSDSYGHNDDAKDSQVTVTLDSPRDERRGERDDDGPRI